MKQITSIALSSLVLSLVGCGDNAEPDPMVPDASNVPAIAFPASCIDAGNGTQVADGEYTLYVGGDEKKPWQAYCHAGNEYLTVHDGTSFGGLAEGGLASGTSVTTTYKKLRIDPETLTIDISDQAFAESQGSIDLGGTHVTSMPLGVAMSCAAGASYGTAGIDLTDTPFRIISAYAIASTNAGSTSLKGAAPLFRDGQWLEAWAEGECGFAAPGRMSSAPINKLADGWLLEVEWFVPTP